MKYVLSTMSLFGIVALLNMIIALSTKHWMKCCLETDDLIKILLKHYDEMGLQKSTAEIVYNLFSGEELCYSVGLFAADVTAGNIWISTAVSQTYKWSELACLPIINGMFILFVSLIFVIKKTVTSPNVRSFSGFYEFRIQSVCYTISTVFILGGMLFYALLERKSLLDPKVFFENFGATVLDQFTDPWTPGLQSATMAVIDKATPYFGASFVLGWIACGLLVVASVLGLANFPAASERKLYSPIASILSSD